MVLCGSIGTGTRIEPAPILGCSELFGIALVGRITRKNERPPVSRRSAGKPEPRIIPGNRKSADQSPMGPVSENSST